MTKTVAPNKTINKSIKESSILHGPQLASQPNDAEHDTSEADFSVRAELIKEHTQAVNEALIITLNTGYTTVSEGLKDAWYQYVENDLTEMTLLDMLDDIFMKHSVTVEPSTGI